MMTVGVISDNHFFHDNIIRYCNRPFRDREHMHESMINDWNSVIEPNQVVIHLGDWFCGGTKEEVAEVISKLNGFKILITGNHDRMSSQWYLDHGVDRVFKHRWLIGMYAFSHRPQDAHYLLENKITYNLHGHSHKHHYGGPYMNFCVDVVGYKPKLIRVNLSEGDLKFKAGKSEPEISWL